MSAPAHSALPASGAVMARTAIPPYAGPTARAVAVQGRTALGPFVPVGLRSRPAPAREDHELPATSAAPSTPDVASAPAFAVPSSIPPYHPLRLTPFASPAVRSRLELTEATAAPDAGAVAGVLDATPANASAGLPWIDAFLASTPAMPLRAVEEQEQEQEQVEVWPLDEAAVEFDAFRARIETERAPADHGSVGASGSRIAIFPRMTAWSDDDMMDIMPVARAVDLPLAATVGLADASVDASPMGGDVATSTSPVGPTADTASLLVPTPFTASPLAATPESPTAGVHEASAEEAAHALELLARRVRAGELMLPGYDPRMGETAALVAALAALLGVRLR